MEDSGLLESSGGHLPKFVNTDFKPNPFRTWWGLPL